MYFIDWIVERLNDASSFFYAIYLEVIGWVYPFWLAADPFYQLSVLFANLAWDFYYFGQWVDSTANELLKILSWETIQSYILSWFNWVSDLSTIFYYFWQNVTNVITSWWNDTSLTVQGWIDKAKQFLQDQIDFVNTWLTNLQQAWDSFKDKIPSIDLIISWFTDWWGKILAEIIAWGALTALQIQDLINTALQDWIPIIESWQDWRDKVIEFIQDPLTWLENKFTDWFLGAE